MSNTKQFLENILKESNKVPYCDDVNCKPIKEDRFPSTDFIKRDWEKLQKDPMINAKEHWSDAYYQEVIDFGKELNKEGEHKHTREEIKGLLDMGAIDDPNYYNGLSDEEKEKLIDYWTEHYDDDLKEAEEEEVQTEEQPQEEVQTEEEPVNDFEQLSPEVQTILNDMSNDNAMYKWVIDDVMDSDISGYNGDTFDEKLKSRLEEITEHGCQSGTVSSLIYYTDTVKFFDNFNDEIYDMIDDMFGAQSVFEMLQQKCDLTDIIMGADTVKNYLAWMAYEVTCSNILDSIESM